MLDVIDLKMHFPIYGGVFRRKKGNVYAVDGISFRVRIGETLGLVGESGCGKTTAGRAIVRLYVPTHGKVIFNGIDMSTLGRKELRDMRRNMQMIFQDPYESLNSRHTVGNILEEPFIIHKIGNSQTRQEAVKELLYRVGLPQNSLERFPHEFSGGQRQRIGIARAIALKPKLIVCDEPVSALDVSIRSQILNLLLDLQQEMKLTYIFIAHDLAAVKHISDNIAVMYLGKIVEYAPANILYASPLHPYTQALISAIPVPDPTIRQKRIILVGDVPSPAYPPPGCRFHPRCPIAESICREKEPALIAVGNSTDVHLAACHLIK